MTANSESGASAEAAQALARLEASLRDCRGCPLCEGRTQVVFGAGDAQADLMFVGEGPGFNEDKQGEPFVGQAGKLLTELLEEVGLTRQEVYIGNVVKCRPPENRDPAPQEIEACSPFLMQQISIIRPRVICTLGRFATRLLAETEQSMTAVHGKAKQVRLAGVDTLIFPVFHPAAALYARTNRDVLVDDFAKLRVLLQRGIEALNEAGGRSIESEQSPAADVWPGNTSTGGGTREERAQPTEQLPLW